MSKSQCRSSFFRKMHSGQKLVVLLVDTLDAFRIENDRIDRGRVVSMSEFLFIFINSCLDIVPSIFRTSKSTARDMREVIRP